MQKTRQQTGCLSPRKRPKVIQNATRSAFLVPFRADRATAASDIVYHVAADDLRRRGGPADHKMSVYAWSAFAARTRIGRIDGRRLHEIRARRSGHFSMPATALHRSESYLSRPVAPFNAMGRALVAPLPPNFCCMPSERAVGPSRARPAALKGATGRKGKIPTYVKRSRALKSARSFSP